MATPPASDEQTDGPDKGTEAAVPAVGPFNALTDDFNDLRIQYQHCWLWPQISLEIDRLDDVLKDGRHLLEPLTTERPDWAVKACTGIARSNPAIHQHIERYDSYAEAARSLWTTFIPATSPTLTDAQIYAVMAMHEARMAAEVYCEIAAGIEEELEQTGIGQADDDGITWPHRRHLETGDGYCMTNNSADRRNREYSYPSIHQSPDGALQIAYTVYRQRIRHVRVDEAWVRAAQPA